QSDGTNTSWQFAPGALYVNVKNSPYNATGNGTTDDTTAINAAIASLTSGGTCFFPPGTYKTSASIVMQPNVHVLGSGRAATTIKIAGNLSAPSTGVFQWQSKDYCSIRELTIDLGGFVGCGITPITSNHWEVRDCDIVHIHD